MICSVGNIDKTKYKFDPDKAEDIIDFFEDYLVHVTGEKAGEPFILEEFQKFHLRNIFGWYSIKTGDRKHRFFYLEMPKGNGKSALESGIVLFMAAVDSPPGSEIYCVAGDTFQARIVFDACREMITENPELVGKFEVYRHSIIHIRSRSVIHVISADAPGKHGFRPYFIAFDELHVQPNRELYDTITKGLMKSRNSMCGIITTAGVKNTFAEEVHTSASQIARGLLSNDYWYVAIYSGYDDEGNEPQGKKIFSKEVIKRANPGYGTIFREDDFDIIVKDTTTQRTGVNSYKRLHLNLWTGSMESYIKVSEFDACNLRPIDLDRHAKDNTIAVGGLDLASTEDLSAFTLLFIDGDTIDWACWFWCPADTIQDREKNENVNYSLWVEEKRVFATPGAVPDKEMIKKFIVEQYERFNVLAIAADPSYHKANLATWVEAEGLPIIPFSQGIMNFSEPTKEFKRLFFGKGMEDRTINHGGNPVLRWQIDNLEVFRDANDNVRPMKGHGKGKHRGRVRKKIDGIVSGIMAVGMLMHKKDVIKKSVYEDRGIWTV